MRKRTSSSPTPRKYKRGRNDNAGFYQDLHKRACDSFKLRLIDEVAKYPILKSESQENTESCYDAWVQIANSIEEDWDVTSTTVMELIEYCRQTWKNLKRAYSRSEKGETSGLGRVIQPMRALFAEIDKTGADENQSNNSSDENNESNNSSEENNESNNSSDENNESNNSSDENNESNNSSDENNESNNSLHENNESNNSPEVGKWKSRRRTSDEFKLKLISEVKKHPSLYESLKVNVDGSEHDKAWEEITEALQVDEGHKYCIRNWKNIRNEFWSYLNGLINTRGAVIQAMEDLFPDYLQEYKNKNASNKKRRQSVRSAVGANHSCGLEGLPSDELQTGAPATESSPPDAVENNAMNNSSEVGSDAAEDIVRPAINHVPVVPSITQPAATPGNPRSTGAGPTERAASLAIVDHLFDSLRSPTGKTHICNMLIQVVYTYRPEVLSDIIKYAIRQPELLNIDWSGLPIPEDLCREMFRRDAEEKLRKVYDEISSSKKPGKKGN